jgi:dipeptidyl aminopeptidase/acylaminoacyl peptidase
MLAGAPPALAAAPAASGPIPAAAFFANPRFNDPKLSPSGRYLAVRVGRPGLRDGLTVVKLADLSATPVAQFGNVDIDDFQWVNDERLVYDTRDNRSAPGDRDEAPGLFAVNRDGGGFLQLVDRGYDQEETTGTHMSRKLLPWNTYLLGQEGMQDSEYVYVVQTERKEGGDLKELTLLRLNTLTGRAQGVPRPPNMRAVRLDAKGEPRLATSYDRNRMILHYREAGADTWRKLADFPAYGEAPGAFRPLGLGADGTLFVEARAGGDKLKVYSYDLVKGELGKQPLIDLGDYDFSGRLVYGGGKLLGVRLLTDASSTHWWSKDMQAVQDKVDQLLPGTVNQIAVPQRPETPWLLVTSWSDQQPRVYVLYNRETQALTKVGAAYPDIPAARMARQQLVHYKARDGLSIPAWLTLPPGGKQNGLPMVVLVHGGPYKRGGEWGWDPDAQFLASRGYAVLEPEFRGSTGFGMRHFEAGFKQWGLAMQDDLADGARAMVAQGVADIKRICIAGASYGGYAALMGVVKDGDLYQCAVDWAGVTDIKLMYNGSWNMDSDLPQDYRQYGMPLLVGDLNADAAQLQATSPLEQAARIKRPLLLAYGSSDQRVPLVHGTRFYEAVKAGNSDVEWVVYDGEGHGWSLPDNRVDFWTRVERFLGKHIGETR